MLVNSGEVTSERFGGNPKSSGLVISPTYFKRTVTTNELAWASIDFGTKVNMPKPRAASAKLGLRFEGKVLKAIAALHQTCLITGVPISFQRKHGEFYRRAELAIPDALLIHPASRTLLVVEVKLRHSTDAWLQLNRFYLPLLRKIVGDSLVLRAVEICRYYDPSVKLPVGKELILKLEDAFKIKGEKHPVLIWER